MRVWSTPLVPFPLDEIALNEPRPAPGQMRKFMTAAKKNLAWFQAGQWAEVVFGGKQ
jgi:hypothetical protein